jgi:general secretion pathway protein D
MRRILLCTILVAIAASPAAAQDTSIVRRTAGGFMVDFQDQDMRLVISALAEAGGLNVSYTNLPNMRTTLRMSNPISQAEIADVLRSIVESNGLRMTQEGSVLRIERGTSPTTTTARNVQAPQEPLLPFIYRLRHANAVQLAQTLTQVFASTGTRISGQPNVIIRPPPEGRGGRGNLQPDQIDREQQEVAVERQAQLARQQGNFTIVAQALAGAGTGEVRVIPEESTNSLIVRATAADWEVVRQVIQAVDLRPPQVLIEVTIAEVRRSADLDIGVSGVATHTKEGRTTPSATLEREGEVADARAFVLELAGGRGTIDFNVALRALAARGDVRILSLPVIFGQNNKEATLNVGSERPFIQTFRTLPTDQGVRDQIVQYRDVGTQLTITPTINPDGYVNLQVTQTANNATNEIQFGAPVINKREASTQIFVRDGQTAVIGGLADNQRERTRTGLPILSSIPWIGALFGSTKHTDIVSELFLFLTPHVVQGDDDMDRVREAIKENTELLKTVPLLPIVPPNSAGPVTQPPPTSPPPTSPAPTSPPPASRPRTVPPPSAWHLSTSTLPNHAWVGTLR